MSLKSLELPPIALHGGIALRMPCASVAQEHSCVLSDTDGERQRVRSTLSHGYFSAGLHNGDDPQTARTFHWSTRFFISEAGAIWTLRKRALSWRVGIGMWRHDVEFTEVSLTAWLSLNPDPQVIRSPRTNPHVARIVVATMRPGLDY